jgi:hypothetical protein
MMNDLIVMEEHLNEDDDEEGVKEKIEQQQVEEEQLSLLLPFFSVEEKEEKVISSLSQPHLSHDHDSHLYHHSLIPLTSPSSSSPYTLLSSSSTRSSDEETEEDKAIVEISSSVDEKEMITFATIVDSEERVVELLQEESLSDHDHYQHIDTTAMDPIADTPLLMVESQEEELYLPVFSVDDDDDDNEVISHSHSVSPDNSHLLHHHNLIPISSPSALTASSSSTSISASMLTLSLEEKELSQLLLDEKEAEQDEEVKGEKEEKEANEEQTVVPLKEKEQIIETAKPIKAGKEIITEPVPSHTESQEKTIELPIILAEENNQLLSWQLLQQPEEVESSSTSSIPSSVSVSVINLQNKKPKKKKIKKQKVIFVENPYFRQEGEKLQIVIDVEEESDDDDEEGDEVKDGDEILLEKEPIDSRVEEEEASLSEETVPIIEDLMKAEATTDDQKQVLSMIPIISDNDAMNKTVELLLSSLSEEHHTEVEERQLSLSSSLPSEEQGNQESDKHNESVGNNITDIAIDETRDVQSAVKEEESNDDEEDNNVIVSEKDKIDDLKPKEEVKEAQVEREAVESPSFLVMESITTEPIHQHSLLIGSDDMTIIDASQTTLPPPLLQEEGTNSEAISVSDISESLSDNSSLLNEEETVSSLFLSSNDILSSSPPLSAVVDRQEEERNVPEVEEGIKMKIGRKASGGDYDDEDQLEDDFFAFDVFDGMSSTASVSAVSSSESHATLEQAIPSSLSSQIIQDSKEPPLSLPVSVSRSSVPPFRDHHSSYKRVFPPTFISRSKQPQQLYPEKKKNKPSVEEGIRPLTQLMREKEKKETATFSSLIDNQRNHSYLFPLSSSSYENEEGRLVLSFVASDILVSSFQQYYQSTFQEIAWKSLLVLPFLMMILPLLRFFFSWKKKEKRKKHLYQRIVDKREEDTQENQESEESSSSSESEREVQIDEIPSSVSSSSSVPSVDSSLPKPTVIILSPLLNIGSNGLSFHGLSSLQSAETTEFLSTPSMKQLLKQYYHQYVEQQEEESGKKKDLCEPAISLKKEKKKVAPLSSLKTGKKLLQNRKQQRERSPWFNKVNRMERENAPISSAVMRTTDSEREATTKKLDDDLNLEIWDIYHSSFQRTSSPTLQNNPLFLLSSSYDIFAPEEEDDGDDDEEEIQEESTERQEGCVDETGNKSISSLSFHHDELLEQEEEKEEEEEFIESSQGTCTSNNHENQEDFLGMTCSSPVVNLLDIYDNNSNNNDNNSDEGEESTEEYDDDFEEDVQQDEENKENKSERKAVSHLILPEPTEGDDGYDSHNDFFPSLILSPTSLLLKEKTASFLQMQHLNDEILLFKTGGGLDRKEKEEEEEGGDDDDDDFHHEIRTISDWEEEQKEEHFYFEDVKDHEVVGMIPEEDPAVTEEEEDIGDVENGNEVDDDDNDEEEDENDNHSIPLEFLNYDEEGEVFVENEKDTSVKKKASMETRKNERLFYSSYDNSHNDDDDDESVLEVLSIVTHGNPVNLDRNPPTEQEPSSVLACSSSVASASASASPSSYASNAIASQKKQQQRSSQKKEEIHYTINPLLTGLNNKSEKNTKNKTVVSSTCDISVTSIGSNSTTSTSFDSSSSSSSSSSGFVISSSFVHPNSINQHHQHQRNKIFPDKPSTFPLSSPNKETTTPITKISFQSPFPSSSSSSTSVSVSSNKSRPSSLLTNKQRRFDSSSEEKTSRIPLISSSKITRSYKTKADIFNNKELLFQKYNICFPKRYFHKQQRMVAMMREKEKEKATCFGKEKGNNSDECEYDLDQLYDRRPFKDYQEKTYSPVRALRGSSGSTLQKIFSTVFPSIATSSSPSTSFTSAGATSSTTSLMRTPLKKLSSASLSSSTTSSSSSSSSSNSVRKKKKVPMLSRSVDRFYHTLQELPAVSSASSSSVSESSISYSSPVKALSPSKDDLQKHLPSSSKKKKRYSENNKNSTSSSFSTYHRRQQPHQKHHQHLRMKEDNYNEITISELLDVRKGFNTELYQKLATSTSSFSFPLSETKKRTPFSVEFLQKDERSSKIQKRNENRQPGILGSSPIVKIRNPLLTTPFPVKVASVTFDATTTLAMERQEELKQNEDSEINQLLTPLKLTEEDCNIDQKQISEEKEKGQDGIVLIHRQDKHGERQQQSLRVSSSPSSSSDSFSSSLIPHPPSYPPPPLLSSAIRPFFALSSHTPARLSSSASASSVISSSIMTSSELVSSLSSLPTSLITSAKVTRIREKKEALSMFPSCHFTSSSSDLSTSYSSALFATASPSASAVNVSSSIYLTPPTSSILDKKEKEGIDLSFIPNTLEQQQRYQTKESNNKREEAEGVENYPSFYRYHPHSLQEGGNNDSSIVEETIGSIGVMNDRSSFFLKEEEEEPLSYDSLPSAAFPPAATAGISNNHNISDIFPDPVIQMHLTHEPEEEKEEGEEEEEDNQTISYETLYYQQKEKRDMQRNEKNQQKKKMRDLISMFERSQPTSPSGAAVSSSSSAANSSRGLNALRTRNSNASSANLSFSSPLSPPSSSAYHNNGGFASPDIW